MRQFLRQGAITKFGTIAFNAQAGMDHVHVDVVEESVDFVDMTWNCFINLHLVVATIRLALHSRVIRLEEQAGTQ